MNASTLPTAMSSAQRLTSLDAFRGAIMLLMASSGLGIPQVAKNFPDSALWKFFGHQCEHAVWAGCTLWDLIQPAFMFMVGVALPWSMANRQGARHSCNQPSCAPASGLPSQRANDQAGAADPDYSQRDSSERSG